MNLFHFFHWLNTQVFALPATILFFGLAIIFSIRSRFLQVRKFPYFVSLLTGGITRRKKANDNTESLSSFHALFTAMATSIGMGNVVSPTVAIISGGPGALFWLLAYMFFASTTKYVEVAFALLTREKTPEGHILGGPMQYLKSVHPFLAYWYGYVMVFLFMIWSGIQANTLANIYAMENIPQWVCGLGLSLFVALALSGGAKRVGALMSKLVPLMFVLYVSFAILILFQSPTALVNAIKLVYKCILTPAAAMGGFAGATVFQAMRLGSYRGMLISEAGVGTSSIPHAIADTKKATDQGVLAMGSMIADATLSMISGMLVLVTGIWAKGEFRSTLIYEVFKIKSFAIAQVVLLVSLTLFIVTTVVGNSFNGTRCFAWLANHRWPHAYLLCTIVVIFTGALMPMPLIWEISDTMLTLVAVPNLIGLAILAYRKPHIFNI